MGTIDRYRKSGGFVQLLQLIETCGPQKQEKFLSMVREEDTHWARAIEEKMLTIEKVLAFSDEALAEIFGNLQELTVAIAFHGLKPEVRPRITKTFTHVKKRKIEDLIEVNKPPPADITSAYIKIMMEVRRLMQEGVLRSDKLDPKYFVEDEIEEKLRKMGDETTVSASLKEEVSAPVKNEVKETPSGAVGGADHEEVKALRRKILQLSEENQNLKHESINLKTKIEQIKKLAG